MKFEIISYLAGTTTNSFTNAQTKHGTCSACKTEMRTTNFYLVMFMILSLLSFFLISGAKASWLTELSPVDNQSQENLDKGAPELPMPAPVKPANQSETFQLSIKEMANELFANLDDSDPQTGLLADGLAFTVFADLKKLTRTSSFGRYLSEQLMGEFQQQGFPVIEVRKSNAIMVMEKRGEYGLSRDLKEIGSAAQAKALLTGTYTVAGDHIMVNAKILDNTNSTMLSSATMLFEKNALTELLLSDSASAHPKKDTLVYMKKLEL